MTDEDALLESEGGRERERERGRALRFGRTVESRCSPWTREQICVKKLTGAISQISDGPVPFSCPD